MLYTEDFSMHHYVGFLQIGSHIVIVEFSVIVEFIVLLSLDNSVQV